MGNVVVVGSCFECPFKEVHLVTGAPDKCGYENRKIEETVDVYTSRPLWCPLNSGTVEVKAKP